MILKQRKAHFKIWMVLGVLLPMLLFLAWSVIPEPSIETGQWKELKITHTLQSSGKIVNLDIQAPINLPGALVLLGQQRESKYEECQVLGQIQGSGSYEFTIPENSVGQYLLLYNPYNKTIVKSLKL